MFTGGLAGRYNLDSERRTLQLNNKAHFLFVNSLEVFVHSCPSIDVIKCCCFRRTGWRVCRKPCSNTCLVGSLCPECSVCQHVKCHALARGNDQHIRLSACDSQETLYMTYRIQPRRRASRHDRPPGDSSATVRHFDVGYDSYVILQATGRQQDLL